MLIQFWDYSPNGVETIPQVLKEAYSILIGTLLALRRSSQPQASPVAEVADMDLAIVSGRGPDILANIDGLKPLVQDEDIVVFGYRDAEQSASYGSQDVPLFMNFWTV
ncbi:MAG: hypothetical protein ACRD5J_02415, partial [Nitrososphaeraceae archaeon]